MDRRTLLSAFLGFVASSILWLVLVNQAPSFGGFAIIADDASVVVADTDVVSYSASRHVLTLTEQCAARLESSRYLAGAFTIVVDGKAVLIGTFVPAVVSRSYPSSELVITYPSFELTYDKIKLQMGYPFTSSGTPDVDDSSITAYFASTGKITP